MKREECLSNDKGRRKCTTFLLTAEGAFVHQQIRVIIKLKHSPVLIREPQEPYILKFQTPFLHMITAESVS